MKLHFLASANTGCGFIDNFNSILEPDKNGFCYILKGGPGTGKSTLLKKIGSYFENKGEDIEYFYCSSDFSSLDGVRIVSKNISIIDGTAPHCKDPNIPNISEKIIDLGQFIGDKVKKHQQKIKVLLSKKQFEYKLAYSYLSACKTIKDTNLLICKSKFEQNLLENYNSVLKKLNLKQQKLGYERKLFINYIQSKTIKSTKDLNNYTIFYLDFDLYTNMEILNLLADELRKLNYKFTSFYDIITNTRNAIFIKDLNLFIDTKNSFENPTIKFNDKIISKLIEKASNSLNSAIKNHKKVEKFYISAMDFDGITNLTNKLINTIEK